MARSGKEKDECGNKERWWRTVVTEAVERGGGCFCRAIPRFTRSYADEHAPSAMTISTSLAIPLISTPIFPWHRNDSTIVWAERRRDIISLSNYSLSQRLPKNTRINLPFPLSSPKKSPPKIFQLQIPLTSLNHPRQRTLTEIPFKLSPLRVHLGE